MSRVVAGGEEVFKSLVILSEAKDHLAATATLEKILRCAQDDSCSFAYPKLNLRSLGLCLVLLLGASASSLILMSCIRVEPPAPAVISGEVEGTSGGTGTPYYPVYRFPPRFAPPRVLHGVEPELTEEAAKARVRGTLTATLYVDEHGIVRSVRILKGLPFGLVDKAVEAFANWHFEPARENGRRVSGVFHATVEFSPRPDH